MAAWGGFLIRHHIYLTPPEGVTLPKLVTVLIATVIGAVSAPGFAASSPSP